MVKEPNKPNRPASAFFVFMEEFRKQKHRINKSIAAVGKAGEDKWKSLSDADKAPYIAKAEERKVEYEKNMKAYYEIQAMPASAFFVFMEEFRNKYKAKYPNNKSVATVGKAGVYKWKSLSDAEKAPYIAKADERKVEYEKNMKAYIERQAEGAKEDEEESEKSMSEVNSEEEDEEGSEEEEEEDEKPNRPASAFFFFMEEFRKQYKAKHPNNKSVATVGKAGVYKWKSLSDAEKATYIAKVGERKVEHEKNMKACIERQAEGAKEDEEESEKSMSEVNSEEEDEEGSEEDDDEKPMSKVNNEEEDEEGSEEEKEGDDEY